MTTKMTDLEKTLAQLGCKVTHDSDGIVMIEVTPDAFTGEVYTYLHHQTGEKFFINATALRAYLEDPANADEANSYKHAVEITPELFSSCYRHASEFKMERLAGAPVEVWDHGAIVMRLEDGYCTVVDGNHRIVFAKAVLQAKIFPAYIVPAEVCRRFNIDMPDDIAEAWTNDLR